MPVDVGYLRCMVYISSWQEYQEAAEALYTQSPQKVSPSRAVQVLREIGAAALIRFGSTGAILRKMKASEGSWYSKSQMTRRYAICFFRQCLPTKASLPLSHLSLRISVSNSKRGSSIYLNRFEVLNHSLMQKDELAFCTSGEPCTSDHHFLTRSNSGGCEARNRSY